MLLHPRQTYINNNLTPESVYWAAIKPTPDRNISLYENEKYTRTDS